jgi:hypothetical protein
MNFNPTKTPFSRSGNWLALIPNQEGSALIIHNARRRFGEDVMFELSFLKEGSPVVFKAEATPWELRITSELGTARFAMFGDSGLIIETEGLEWSLKMPKHFGYGISEGEKRIKIISSTAHNYTGIDVPQGRAVLAGPAEILYEGHLRDRASDLLVGLENGKTRALIEISHIEPSPRRPFAAHTFDSASLSARAEWEAFVSTFGPVPSGKEYIAALARYTLWATTVPGEYPLPSRTILMSKSFMCALWSWDHCFNALSLVKADPDFALEQFLIPFANQAPGGGLPDCIAPNQEIIWAVTKPPIHGWCFGLMLDRHPYGEAVLARVYQHLSRWTEFWFEYRDADQDGIPDVPMGCDSWDNSTLLDFAFYVESPELPAYLVLQQKLLARLALKLGQPTEAADWDRRAAELLNRLIAHSWNGSHFVAKRSGSHESVPGEPTSLLALMPLVLGNLLPPDIFELLVTRLEKDFITERGLASESVSSPLYETDAYWRGSTWAPIVLLLADGLHRGGRPDLARRLAATYSETVEKHAAAHYEGFNSLTGAGQRAPGYSWSASVHLELLEYLRTSTFS